MRFRSWLLVGLAVALVPPVVAASASAAPAWRIAALSNTTALPGETITYYTNAVNIGSEETNGTAVVTTIALPAGLTAVSASGHVGSLFALECTAGDGVSPVAGASTIRCETTHTVSTVPARSLRYTVVVAVGPGVSVPSALTSSFGVSGGGAPPSSSASTVDVTRIDQPPGFGVAAFDSQASADAEGAPLTQAGAHPYAVSSSFDFNTVHNQLPLVGDLSPVAPPKDVVVDLPPGLAGSLTGVDQCTTAQLAHNVSLSAQPLCPVGSQVGSTLLRLNGLTQFPNVVGPIPVFNMVPPPGAPVQFGFNVFGVVVTLSARLRNGDYGVSVEGRDLPEGLAFAGTTVTFWGVPADPSHNPERACSGQPEPWQNGPTCTSSAPRRAVLRNPTSCTQPGEGLPWVLHSDSWDEPGVFTQASFRTHALPGFPAAPSEWGAPLGITGCDDVPFTPSMLVAPANSSPDAPSGLDVNITVPQEALTDPGVIAQADLKKTVVVLPEGVVINPAAAGGLNACTPSEVDLHGSGGAHCPDASKVGSVEIHASALEEPLEGSVYIASQGDNPFGSLLAVYLVAEAHGVIVKAAGHIEADPLTGRLTTTFDNLPQQPVDSVKLTLAGGPRAPLTTPSTCGGGATVSTLEGWNAKSVSISSPYTVDCTPGLGGFAPSFVAGTVNPQAGAFSPFTLTFSRHDGEQGLGGLTVKTPPGLLGILKSVARCPEPQASQGACGEDSLLGHVTAATGSGPDPFYVTGGWVYLTGPYKGSPFGLSVVVPAKAGPFDLGTVVVRSRVDVDPHTSQITIASDPFPTILQGIPLQIRTVNVTVDRAGFMFNPTDCEPLAVNGTLSSAQGATMNVSSRFQVANCATLGFHPVFGISTQASTSKKNGASLDVKTTFPTGAQANIRSAVVTLPRQLPARLTTIQQACPEATFAQNPAGCPAASAIGMGTATTPILASPLVGPAYLVSHGGAAFPDVVIVFQSEGVTFDLVGGVNIRHGITTSSFTTVPDAPISVFELKLPEGPHSGLAANLSAKAKGSMCGQSLAMPIALMGQNGATLKENPKIKVTGCPKTRKAKRARKHTPRAHGKAKQRGKKGAKK